MNPVEESKREVGDLLFDAGKLDAQQLDHVRRRQKRLRTPQHHAIVELGFASETDTYTALAGVLTNKPAVFIGRILVRKAPPDRPHDARIEIVVSGFVPATGSRRSL